MGSMIDSFSSVLTPQAVDRIGNETRVAPNHVMRGLGIIGPLVAGLTIRPATMTGSLRPFLDLVPPDIDRTSGVAIDAILKAAKDPHVADRVMNGVLGAGHGAINRTLMRVLGFEPSRLLRIGTILTLAAIAGRVRELQLDNGAAIRQMQDELRVFLARGDEVSRTVKEAMVAADEAAALRQRYTPHEWASARLAPLAAAHVVTMASQSGVLDTTNEISSATEEIRRARGSSVPASLVGVLFDGALSHEDVEHLDDREIALGVVREGIAAVKANTPSEAKSYTDLLLDVAIRTAHAGKEGRVVGFNGIRVSKEEQAAIEEIRNVVEMR